MGGFDSIILPASTRRNRHSTRRLGSRLPRARGELRMLRGVQALLDQGQDGGQITAQQDGGIQPGRFGRFGQALKIGKDKEYGASVDVSAMSSKEQRGILGSLFVPVESAWPVPSASFVGWSQSLISLRFSSFYDLKASRN